MPNQLLRATGQAKTSGGGEAAENGLVALAGLLLLAVVRFCPGAHGDRLPGPLHEGLAEELGRVPDARANGPKQPWLILNDRRKKDPPCNVNYYIGYFGGALIIVPIGALIAKHATAWVAGFKTRYMKALVSTIVAFLAVNAVGLVFYALGTLGSFSRGLQLLIGWGALSCSHIYLLRSESGDRLTPGKSMIVAICQIFGAMLALLVVLLVLVAIKRVFL
jgi:hypothetical protein